MVRFSRSIVLWSAAVFAIPHMVVAAQSAAAPPTARQVVVAVDNAQLKRGDRAVATVRYGQRLRVMEQRGAWLGTVVTVNGRRVAGWVKNNQTSSPEQFASRQTMRRYSYQPSAGNGGNAAPRAAATNTLPPDMGDYTVDGLRSSSPLIMGESRYGRGYWRADRKIIGN